MAKLIELRPSKDLLDPNFESYKLSLDPLPVYKHSTPVAVDQLKPNDEQFSYQHVKVFGLHNHLVSDPWNSELVYFISKDLQIFQAQLHSLASHGSPVFKSVCQIPMENHNKSGSYNSSLSFAGENMAVATDGSGVLHLIDTLQRNSSHLTPWKIQFSSCVLGSNKPFKILHSFLEVNEADQLLNVNVLLLRVEPLDGVEAQVPLSTLGCNERETPFVSCLEFLSYQNKNGHWALDWHKRLVAPFGVEFASILSPGKSLCVIAREPIGLVFNSLKCDTIPSQDAEPLDAGKPLYTWYENVDEVIMWMSFEKGTIKQDVQVIVEEQSLKITHKSEAKIDGRLAHKVSFESSRWTLSDGKLELVLPKAEKSNHWDYLIENCLLGQKDVGDGNKSPWHQRLVQEDLEANANRAPVPIFSGDMMEECDVSESDEINLFRFDGETNQLSHKALLGRHQLLFVAPTEHTALAFCLRHDVDGLVWLPMEDAEKKEEEPIPKWNCHHIGTLQALGYIQASKEQRKFTVCSPNFSYAAVCDTYNHVYIYRQPNDGPCEGVELVHRPTGRKVGKVARQQVLNLDSAEEVLGALATDTFLLILTSSSLFAIRINSD